MVQLLVSEVLQCEEKTQKKILNEFMRIYYSLSFSPVCFSVGRGPRGHHLGLAGRMLSFAINKCIKSDAFSLTSVTFL